MASLVLSLCATVLFVQSTDAFNCSKKPIYVDIHKRAVHDSPVFQYGSFIGLGTPAQNQSLWPSLAQNHTSFASHVYCKDNSTLKNCDRSTGGFFNHQESTSYVTSTSTASLSLLNSSQISRKQRFQDSRPGQRRLERFLWSRNPPFIHALL